MPAWLRVVVAAGRRSVCAHALSCAYILHLRLYLGVRAAALSQAACKHCICICPPFTACLQAHAIASVFSVIAIALSCHLMYKHLQHYARPLLQRQIIRIVMIVPVYAFCSALSLGFDHYAPYINAREYGSC